MNFIKRIVLIVSCLLLPTLIIAQNFSISGSVKDEHDQLVSFANVIVSDISNSAIIHGTTTDESGTFKLVELKQSNYAFQVSYLGYITYRDTLDLSKDLKLKTIILKEKTEELDGVTIIAKKPTVKRLVDRLVFNVENSTLSENNVLDVLKHTPGVLVRDQNITVKNRTPSIYINDRKVHLSSEEVQQLLEGTSATNIKSIEVITNPPTKYEAEGGVVLNIITSKNVISGYNGSVFGNYKQGKKFPKYSIGTSHFFKTKNLNAYVNYSISPRKDYRQIDESINFFDNNQPANSWETDFERERKTGNQSINTNLEYELDQNNRIGFTTNIFLSPEKSTEQTANSTTAVYNSANQLDSTFVTSNSLISKKNNLAFTLDYLHKFKREGEKLLVSAHHTSFDFTSNQNVDTDYYWPDNSLIRNSMFQTLSSQEIKLYTGQIDYELPIKETKLLEAGAKFTDIDSKNILEQYNFMNGQSVIDPLNSDNFLYDETIYASYLSYTSDFENWNLKLGLRAEYTDIKSNSQSTNTLNENDYFKLFPSFHILKPLSEENELYFNYNKRIQRPRYRELNPFKYYLNENNYIVGDPELKPQIDDVLTFGYTFRKDFTFELYYRYERNPIIELTIQDNENNELQYAYTNLDHAITYGLDFTTYTELFPNWNLYALASVFYYDNKFYSQDNQNDLLNNDKWSFYTQIINYFSFLKDNSLTADLTFLFISPVAEGPVDVSSRSSLDINLRKTFCNKRASLSLGFTDIFDTLNFNQTTRYQNQDIYSDWYTENKMFTIGFNYKFGNFRLTNNKKEIDLKERDRLKERD
ncbi:outer membrane beta-barrel family protein [Yeosuana sp. MJ-SS3]|uniref:Outer membrane beta-barrel family protein n=1 Tax=Gilvirhabdus luticola TaxID=3079858 RepID=A0ABU3U2T0_9FLAO|nr:outer membrane beta-barrel family protein [Yeosuana sp. MJ-SS3]MDU8884716.1 outer membrane beta-barrel family protein [Yeosuana sp. MJ-SS3]